MSAIPPIREQLETVLAKEDPEALRTFIVSCFVSGFVAGRRATLSSRGTSVQALEETYRRRIADGYDQGFA